MLVPATLAPSQAGTWVSSIYYTFWLSRESNLRLICPQLQKEDLQVEVHVPEVRLIESGLVTPS